MIIKKKKSIPVHISKYSSDGNFSDGGINEWNSYLGRSVAN